MAERELALQVIDLAGLLGDLLRAFLELLPQPLVLAPQPLHLLRACIRRTPIASPPL